MHSGIFHPMSRGYRCIILALVGIVLIGAGEPPKGGPQSDQFKEQREIAASLREISATLKRASEPDQSTEPCDPDKPNRKSDLCAQWKAADAAANAAEAGWLQVWIGTVGVGIGLLTLAAAGAAALYAKRAVAETKAGNELTEEIGDLERRPWLDFSIVACRVDICEDITVLADIEIKNIGNSPSQQSWAVGTLRTSYSSYIETHQFRDMALSLDYPQRPFNGPGISGHAILPNQTIGESLELKIPAQWITRGRGAGQEIWILLGIRLYYIFRGKRRFTDRYFRLGNAYDPAKDELTAFLARKGIGTAAWRQSEGGEVV